VTKGEGEKRKEGGVTLVLRQKGFSKVERQEDVAEWKEGGGLEK
jgi:hypothetical protein